MKRNAQRNRRRATLLAAATLGLTGAARAQYVPIYGGLTDDNGCANAQFYFLGVPVNDTGIAVGHADRTMGTFQGIQAVRWDSTGNAMWLGNLGTEDSGFTGSRAYAINAAGQTAGNAYKYVGGTGKGQRAVRFDPTGSALELGNLGTDTSGVTNSNAYSINTAGQIAGGADKYVSGTKKGDRAVRWDAAGGALELGNLGTDASGVTTSYAYSINAAGQTAGRARKYVSSTDKGQRAVRWDSNGAVLELGNLGTDASGVTDAQAYGINSAGQTAGYSQKYVSGTNKGNRAARWDAAGSALELGNLGTDTSGVTISYAYSINAAGQTAGLAFKYVGGNNLGNRAARWDAAGNVLELGNLGTDATGFSDTGAFSINTAGQTAGYALKYVGGVSQGRKAVYWNTDGSVVDLNTLISPGSNWTLTQSRAITDSGWVAGYGDYDPDGGGGPLAPYQRHFVLDISPVSLLGDFNNDGQRNAADIDLLCIELDSGGGAIDPQYDVNGDSSVNMADLTYEVQTIIGTHFGDTDTDGDVDLADLGNLASGFGQPGEKRWSKGNFDCDNDVDLSDLGTLATNFQAGRAAAFAEFPGVRAGTGRYADIRAIARHAPKATSMKRPRR